MSNKSHTNYNANNSHVKQNIIIYRDRLLRLSEGFVLSQGESIKEYHVYYAGSSILPELRMPTKRTITINGEGLYGNCAEGLFKVFGIAPGFYRALRKINPLLIHAHFGIDGALSLPLATYLQIPLIVTFHGYDATIKDEYMRKIGYSCRLYLRRRGMLQRGAKLFIAVSNFIKDRLIEKGFPRERIFVHYIGVNLNKFKPDPKELRKPIVLYVGRLSEEKGCEYLIYAMAKVQTIIPEVETVIIGDGPLMSKLKQLAREKLSNYKFLGAQTSDNVRIWMNRAKVLCGLSVSNESGACEAFGIVFAEAQAMGLPVVASNIGGIPEAVLHGETGLLSGERDWELAASYILNLLKDHNLWRRFSVKGREHVKRKFDLESQSRMLEEIYSAVLRGDS
jgi:colanic acid/amylovoran biosynthesis glycosyltransferase